MTHIIVPGNKTLGVNDDGILQLVRDTSIITIPNDSTYDFVIDDEIEIFRDTANVVRIVAASGVTIRAKGLNIDVSGRATFKKIGANDWIGYGDLS